MLMNFCFTQPTKSVHIAKVIINEKTLVIFSWKLKTGLDLQSRVRNENIMKDAIVSFSHLNSIKSSSHLCLILIWT